MNQKIKEKEKEKIKDGVKEKRELAFNLLNKISKKQTLFLEKGIEETINDIIKNKNNVSLLNQKYPNLNLERILKEYNERYYKKSFIVGVSIFLVTICLFFATKTFRPPIAILDLIISMGLGFMLAPKGNLKENLIRNKLINMSELKKFNEQSLSLDELEELKSMLNEKEFINIFRNEKDISLKYGNKELNYYLKSLSEEFKEEKKIQDLKIIFNS